MGHSNSKARLDARVLYWLCCTLILLATACGGGGGGGSSSSETGAVSFGLMMLEPGAGGAPSSRAVADDAVRFKCRGDDYEISTIGAEIRDVNGEVVASGGPFSCEAGEGSIEGVPPGDNYVVHIFARDVSGEILFTGSSEPISVLVGQVTDAGVIVLEPINARLRGDFGGTGYGAEDDDGFTFDFAVLFNSTFFGDGTANYTELANSSFISGPGTISYDLSFDGSLVATLTDSFSDVSNYTGILNADNNILAVADTDFGDPNSIEIDVAIKKSSGLTNAVLNGEYIGVRIGSDPFTALTSMKFSEIGNERTYNFLAASNDQLINGEFDYILNSDGGLSITGAGTINSDGIVSSDGSVIALADTQFRGDFIDMTVLIKSIPGLSETDVDGDYIGVSLAVTLGSGEDQDELETTVWAISADGINTIDFTIQENSNDPPTTGTLNASYSVETIGVLRLLRIELQNGQLYRGAVSENGDIFTFVDTDDSDGFIEMGVAIRKSE